MRYGFTTGSCAAAAAKAAAYMLLTGREKTEITIETPKGILYTAQIRNICRKEQEVSCAVEKDGGDDPDITTGALICAKVSFAEITDRKAREEPGRKNGTGHAPEQAQVVIDGGIGVGRVTKPGLDQPVGNAAINHVPREMIEREVLQVCQVLDYRGILSVEISVPEGEKLAEKTFNPRLGIVGGISILGTSGVVEPMSTQAILDTIRVELRQQRALGREDVVISPGNYGLDFLCRSGLELPGVPCVKCSNFLGEALDMAGGEGFSAVVVVSHAGKLVKVAGGVMNTHSRLADCRMEILVAHAAVQGADQVLCRRLMEVATVDAGIALLEEAGLRRPVMASLMAAIQTHLERRAGGVFQVGAVMFSNEYGLLGQTRQAEELLSRWRSA